MKNCVAIFFCVLTCNTLYAQKKHTYHFTVYTSYDLTPYKNYTTPDTGRTWVKHIRHISSYTIGPELGVSNHADNYWQFGLFYTYLPEYYKCNDCPNVGWIAQWGESSKQYERKTRSHYLSFNTDFNLKYLKRKRLNLYASIGHLLRFQFLSTDKYSYWKVNYATQTIDPGPYYGKSRYLGDWESLDYAFSLGTGIEYLVSETLSLQLEPIVRSYFDFETSLEPEYHYKGISINLSLALRVRKI